MNDAKFEALFDACLEELYDAENQMVTALPEMIAAAFSEELARGLQQHLDQTKEHIRRLQSVFDGMGEQPGSRLSEGMQGLLMEGERLIRELPKSRVLDAGLIGAARKAEHYEIAAYETARAIAEIIGQQETAVLLQETLEEEIAADELLGNFADSILTGAGSGVTNPGSS